jgi:hypothetical protein
MRPRLAPWSRSSLQVLRNLDPAGRGRTTGLSAPKEMSLVSPREMTRKVTPLSPLDLRPTLRPMLTLSSALPHSSA